MRLRTLACALVAIPIMAGSAWAGQDTSPTIAVLAFEDGGSYGQDQADFAALERGIAGMLISELSLQPDSRLIDRSETQRMFDRLGPAEGRRVNAATAASIGQLVGARYVVFGTFVDMYGKFRIDARVVGVETGEIIHVATASDDRESLFLMVQEISREILADLGLPVLPADIVPERAGRNIPTDALVLYSLALLFQDQGDTSRAMEAYRSALEVSPTYREARQGLQSIETP